MASPRTEPRPGESATSGGSPAEAAGPSLRAAVQAPPMALALVGVVGAIFVWWGWKEGAYFGTVFFPGAIILYAVVALLLLAAPFNGRLGGPPRLALAAILALG